MCQILGLPNCVKNNIISKGVNLGKKTIYLFGTVVFCDCTVIESDRLANHKKKIMPKKFLFSGNKMLSFVPGTCFEFYTVWVPVFLIKHAVLLKTNWAFHNLVNGSSSMELLCTWLDNSKGTLL